MTVNSDIARLRHWTEAAEETRCRKPHKHWHIEGQPEDADEAATIWTPAMLLAALDVIEAARDEAQGIADNETPHVAANMPLVRAVRNWDAALTDGQASSS